MNATTPADRLARLVATFFYLGYFPFAAGSLASAWGALLWFGFLDQPAAYLGLMAIVIFLGFWSGGKVEKALGKKDPSCVVIDEVAGAMIAFMFLPPTLPVFWCAFFLFRAFDMFKIYPANKFEARGGASGIMMDDIVAGLYTNIVMQVAVRLAM